MPYILIFIPSFFFADSHEKDSLFRVKLDASQMYSNLLLLPTLYTALFFGIEGTYIYERHIGHVSLIESLRAPCFTTYSIM
jgi:hypothetical protein